MDNYQPIDQAGFKKGFSTTGHLLTLKVLIEKVNEYKLPLYLAFIDFEKAFDSISFWAVKEDLLNSSVNSRYTSLIENIYKQETTIQLDENLKSNPISITKGVRQGDIISPKLFTLALEDIFKSLEWSSKGIFINGKRLNHLRFANDVLLISDSYEHLQNMINELQEEANKKKG